MGESIKKTHKPVGVYSYSGLANNPLLIAVNTIFGSISIKLTISI